MDRLNDIWEIQRRFNENFISSSASIDAKVAYTKEMLLHIVAEIDELLNSTGKWKNFRFSKEKPTISGIVEEAVDIWKFLLNILIVFDVKPGEFFEEFKRKSIVVEERYKWEKLLRDIKPTDKVAALDLDGVLARYPENWIEFVNRELGTNYTIKDFEFCEAPLPQIPRQKYYELKHKFREEGWESLHVWVFEDAPVFTRKLKEMGYKIVILSARPYKKYKRIQADTIQWMKRFHISYDAFLWDNEKHMRILEEVPNLSFMVEDDLKIANEVGALGYKVFLRDRPYNRGRIHSPNVIRVRNLLEILEKIREVEKNSSKVGN